MAEAHTKRIAEALAGTDAHLKAFKAMMATIVAEAYASIEEREATWMANMHELSQAVVAASEAVAAQAAACAYANAVPRAA